MMNYWIKRRVQKQKRKGLVFSDADAERIANAVWRFRYMGIDLTGATPRQLAEWFLKEDKDEQI